MTESKRKLFVLDTNVLMHDPSALFRFHEHDIFLPMVVLEELDAGKKGLSEPARNVRQVSRFLDEMMKDAAQADIKAGLAIGGTRIARAEGGNDGRLFFQTESLAAALPESLPGHTPDNTILAVTLALQNKHTDISVILVSKDINLRIKAAVLGIHAEDYYNDKALEDADMLFTGIEALPADFWETHSQDMESWQENGRAFYRMHGPLSGDWHPQQCVYLDGEGGIEAVVRVVDHDSAVIERANDYRAPRHTVWGINPRNREQNFAMNLLMDPDVDFVTLLGAAGTGKTLLALAAGLAQTFESNLYREIIMTRVTVPLAEDIGFLPGTEEEKMTPWMGALMDNLEVLSQSGEGGEWGRAATNDMLRSRIKIRSLNFMRGRTFLNRYIIVDEAQNLTPKQMKALITRAGVGTKIVCLGNIAQIDTPYLTETTSGLTYVVDRFKNGAHAGHVTLLRGERSRLADYANEVL
ncbi:MAG TPA: PhoH family protein [Gammaproteobacteria bacterium]|nr:PhoH family protein [Gammaproteobacteria bacterium]